MMQPARTAAIAGGVVVALLLAALLFFRPAVVAAPASPAPLAPEGSNGLGDRDRSAFYHLSEGGELYPVTWLQALEVETPMPDGTIQARPFLDNVERYGFLADPKGSGN